MPHKGHDNSSCQSSCQGHKAPANTEDHNHTHSHDDGSCQSDCQGHKAPITTEVHDHSTCGSSCQGHESPTNAEAHNHAHSHDHKTSDNTEGNNHTHSHNHGHNHDHGSCKGHKTSATTEDHSHAHSHDHAHNHDHGSCQGHKTSSAVEGHNHAHSHDHKTSDNNEGNNHTHTHNHGHIHDHGSCKGHKTSTTTEDQSHAHSHDHAHNHDHGSCKGHKISTTEDHTHTHTHIHNHSSCKGHSHAHSHKHAHNHDHGSCKGHKASDTTENHSHAHSHNHGSCKGHSHAHSHNHAHSHDHGSCKGHNHGNQTVINLGQEGLATRSQSSSSEDQHKLVFKIDGMCCGSEVDGLKNVLNPLIQNKNVFLSFDLINAKLIVEGSPDSLPTKEEITKAVARTGMKATLWSDHIQKRDKTFWENYGHKITCIISLIGLVAGLTIQAVEHGAEIAFGGSIEGAKDDRPPNPPVATIVLYCISILAGGWFIYPKAYLALIRLRPNTKLLIVLATGGAIAINSWFEAAISMFLFSAAELLESWNMDRARKSIRSLLELAPSTATVVKEDGTVSEQSVDEIPIGTILTIKPGEKIPMDSVLVSGTTSVNQAPITGESLPVQKESGDELFAGTINGDSAIQCKVTKAASDSTLASIIRKVEEAQSKRAKSDQWVEKFSLYYVPIMIFSSLVVMIVPPLVLKGEWYPWIYKGLELLVISCPCSLIVSTPVSIVAGITAAAKKGVLIKGGIHLESAAYLKAFAMDKTGTITTGKPVVANIIPLNGCTVEEVLRLGACLEVNSDHPLASAIILKAKTDGVSYQPADQFQVLKGRGAEGYIKDKLYWVGSHRYVHEKLGDNETKELHEKITELENMGHSIVAIGHDLQICGLISIADGVRPESASAIQAMKKAGIKKVVMLTGDNKGAARVIAESVNIEYYAELLPEDKVTRVEGLVKQYKNVAMVGDGINDAPAMAAASLGIAMGVAGSDTAIETADIALMSDDLEKLAWLVKHSRHTLNIIIQNVIISLVIKSVFIGLTFADKSSLWLAIIADMGATFIVVSNALRLVAFTGDSKSKQKTEVQHKEKAKTAPTLTYQSTESDERLNHDPELGPYALKDKPTTTEVKSCCKGHHKH